MSDTVQQIKDRLSIVDVVSQYVKLDRAGNSLRARCPFHAEKSPSFFVSPDRGTYHCFGCGVGGDIFSFVEAVEGIDFKGALKILADKAGVELVYEKPEKKDERERLFELMEVATIFYASKLDAAAHKYLNERGIEEPIIKAFRLGFAGDAWSDLSEYLRVKKFTEKEIIDAGMAKKSERGSLTDKFRNRIMFPIADSAGRIIAFSGRTFPVKPAATGQVAQTDGGFEPPKYMNSPETPLFHKSRVLYGFDHAKLAIRKINCAVLVEGQMDLLASHQAGWGNTVAVSGTAFTPEHAALIRRMTDNIVIALDADPAGIKAAGRAARAALQAGLNVKVARLPTGQDPADYILKDGADAWRAAIRDSKDIITFLLDVLEEHTPQPDRFRRVVELVVLPFLSDVQSPIAREQYVHEIARRLQVSEAAVSETLEHMPRSTPQSESGGSTNLSQGEQDARQASADRVRKAFSLLLWQKSIAKPDIDVVAYARDFEEAIGSEAFAQLQALPEAEQEQLRFAGERLHGKSTALQGDVKTLLHVIRREHLLEELARATSNLKRAELAQDEAAIAEYMGLCQVLTTRIAELHKAV